MAFDRSGGSSRAAGRLALVVLATLSIVPAQPAAADPNGDAGVCTDQCTKDSNGSFESCHRICMSERSIYNNAPNEPMRPMPRPPTLYGAIAVDLDSLIPGYGKDYPSRADAERRAIAMCRRAGGAAGRCKVVIWGHNRCLALTTSVTSKSGYAMSGYDWSDDGYVARKKALQACRKAGGTACKVAVSLCTG